MEEVGLFTSFEKSASRGKEVGFFGLSKRQGLLIVVFGLADFFSAVTFSLQAPFFPNEAEKKGATATEYGLIFGIFELTAFIVSPLYGKYMYQIGPKLLFKIGIFTAGTSSIAFGFLDRIEDKSTFLILSFFIRIVESLGASACSTSSFTIIAMEFPNSVATTFAFLETFFGLGLIAGPTLGGALYEAGGYTFPFALMGGLLFLSGIFVMAVMPKGNPNEEANAETGFGIFSVLKVPQVLIAGFTITAGTLSIGFVSAILEPHIRRFNLSPFMTGLIFIVNGGTYAMSAPVWGRIVDRLKEPLLVTLFGLLTVICGFCLIGPVPFIPIDTMIWLTCTGLFLQGLGIGAILPSAFVAALRGAISNGSPDSVETYGLISGIWKSMFAIGAFVGPSIGGFLYDNVGFRNGTLFVIGAQLIVTGFLITFIVKKKLKKQNEYEPLLSTPEPETTHGIYGGIVNSEINSPLP